MRLGKNVFFAAGFVALLVCTTTSKTFALTNLASNGSFDSGPGGWDWSGELEVYNGLRAGYVVLHRPFGGSGLIWQDLDTVPGRDYIVRFGARYSLPHLHWGDQTYTTFTNTPFPSTWQHFYIFVTAASSVTRLSFECVGEPNSLGLDNVLVGWLLEPASIITQPLTRSVPEGGSAGFTVQADGGPPLFYQWFFNDQTIDGATNHYIVKHDITAADQGDYHVIVSNAANAVTSTVATLTVDSAPREPQIVLHPESQDVAAGYRYYLRAAAIGTLPLSYQWLFNGSELPGATNPTLTFPVADYTNSGTYIVRVSNHRGSALSLPATLNVYTLANPGGWINVNTAGPAFPAFDVDGYTPLTPSNFVAQVYAGPSPMLLRAVGAIAHFNVPTRPGCVISGSIRIADVPPGNLVYGQLRAWQAAFGTSYEEARARGGKFGFSSIVSVRSGQPPIDPAGRLPIDSFSLRYGLPEFTTGKLQVSQRLPDGTLEWLLIGEPGFRYLIEKRLPPHNWEPLAILTNDVGQVTFTDPNQQSSSLQFYRSRLLE